MIRRPNYTDAGKGISAHAQNALFAALFLETVATGHSAGSLREKAVFNFCISSLGYRFPVFINA